jgi:quercetin dioxygenase-like cupin family protein
MANSIVTNVAVGSLRLSVHDFAAPGDILPMHVHDEHTAHITLIQRGAIIVRTPEKTAAYGAPDILDFPAGEPHEFEATEPNTRITNIVKG